MNRERPAHAVVTLTFATLLLGSPPPGAAESPATSSIDLLSSDKTVLGQPLFYPDGAPADVDAKMVTIPPGGETGWHQHETMMIGYIVSGRITVEYRDKEPHVYEAGQVLVEALDWSHNGRNESSEPVRILAISLGTPPDAASRSEGGKPIH